MVSKAAWASGSLAGMGLGLIGIQTFWFATRPTPDVTALLHTTTAVILAVALVYLAFWLHRGDLQEAHTWAVARWAAIGLAIPALPIGAMALFGPSGSHPAESSLLVTLAAASAAIGALFGAVTVLDDEQCRIRTLNRRNAVLNRVLRHDVLNDAGLLLLFADRLENDAGAAADELADPIRAKTEEIMELSRTAQRVERLDDEIKPQPTNVVEVIEAQVETVRQTRPAVEIETDLPDAAWVAADDLLGAVIDNLVENAIGHNDRTPKVRISVHDPGATGGAVEVCIADNGPGIPPATARALSRQELSEPTAASHRIGLGLWLVKWFVDAYDGELTMEDRVPRGTVVRLSLPAATPVAVA